MHAYTNTLRIELAPFDVKVINIITGGVQSRLQRVKRALPEDSYYMPINDQFERRLNFSEIDATPTEEYARRVVDAVLLPNPPKSVWEGNKSWVVWFATTYLPSWVMVSLQLENDRSRRC